MGRGCDARGQARGIRAFLGAFAGLARKAARRQTSGGGQSFELRRIAQGDDRVRPVRASWLANQQFDDRKRMRSGAAPGQRSGQAMGRRQRRGDHRAGDAAPKQPMEGLLGNLCSANELKTPGKTLTPSQLSVARKFEENILLATDNWQL